MFPSGKQVIGRITNTAISSIQTIAFKDVNGGTHTFAAGERLIIHNLIIANRATAKDVTILQDTDAGGDNDSGEEIANVSFAGQDHTSIEFGNGLPTKRINTAGTNLFKAIGSAAGSVDILVVGEVVKS